MSDHTYLTAAQRAENDKLKEQVRELERRIEAANTIQDCSGTKMTNPFKKWTADWWNYQEFMSEWYPPAGADKYPYPDDLLVRGSGEKEEK